MSILKLREIIRRLCSRLCLGILIVAMAFSGCMKKESTENAPKKGGPVPVVVAPVIQKSVPVQIQAIGNVESYSTVSIKARIDGQIFKVHFKEGQDVRKDDLLFDIDSRDLESQLRQAEANLAKDKAQLEYARSQENRYEALFKEGVVSKELYTQMHTALDTLFATIQADEAAIESAKVKLEYCKIRSPIDGRTGKMLINEGNMIKANDVTPLVIINQVIPIYVTFSVPEKFLDTIRKYNASGTLAVVVSPAESDVSSTGKLVFIDNAVDLTTGTIKLKASFANTNRRLWPGQFVNVSLTLYEQKDAVIIPSQALQVGPSGQYVYVVKPDLTAEFRLVNVDRSNATETVIAKGLSPGENVVTVGQIRLSPGAKVQPKPAQVAP